jgi:hypothetical protein
VYCLKNRLLLPVLDAFAEINAFIISNENVCFENGALIREEER